MQQEFRADLDDGEGQGDMALKQDAIDQQRRKEVRKIIYMHFRALLCLCLYLSIIRNAGCVDRGSDYWRE